MSKWKTFALADLADIRISNVDKKSFAHETAVRLCNYMDVYSNDYLTADIDYMAATASTAEIEKFKVEPGDVLITKDSETPFDIGIPSVVTDEVPHMVCGYHLALIKPRKNLIDPIFLSKQLASPQAASYFSRLAAGSTRYGLSNGAIARTRISAPSVSVQRKIARILQTIDQAVEHTTALIVKYQQIKAGLMHDLFTRGIGADGKLRPPREQAPELYQQTPIGWIPNDWQYQLLDNLAERGSGHTPSKSHPEYWGGGIKWVSLADSFRLDDLYIDDTEYEISAEGLRNSSAVLHPAGSVIMSRDAGVGRSAIIKSPMAVSQHFMCWRCEKKMDNHFLYYWLQHNKRNFENIAMGSTILTIGLSYFKRLKVACPTSKAEQTRIGGRLKSMDASISTLKNEKAKLRQKKNGLMYDLLTGKVTVTPNTDTKEAADVQD